MTSPPATSASPSRLLPPSRLPTLPPPRSASSTLSTRSLLSTNNSALTTPSLLTPNTRAEAEAAFSSNCAFQTDAAAPTTPNMSNSDSTDANATGQPLRPSDLGVRPPFPTRSSTNYFHALEALAREGKGLAPAAGYGIPGGTNAANNSTSTLMETEKKTNGVADTHEDGLVGGPVGGVEDAAPPAVEWKPELARQQSWSQQDMHRVMQERLMAKTDEADMGYDSASGERV